jgi:hypothetical protein
VADVRDRRLGARDYAAGRGLSQATLQRLAGKKLGRASEAIRQRGFAAVLGGDDRAGRTFSLWSAWQRARCASSSAIIFLRRWWGCSQARSQPRCSRMRSNARSNIRNAINYWVVAAVIAVLVALMLVARRWLLKLQQQV